MEAGDRFQQETKYVRGQMGKSSLDWEQRPATHKTYADAPQVRLPDPKLQGGRPLWSVLAQRRSVRRYAPEAISPEQLSQLLWAMQGVTHYEGGYAFRTAPSAGALYPIETYVAVHAVNGLDSGIYHYAIKEHLLEQLQLGDVREPIARAALDQSIAYQANCVIVWTAVFERSKWKYGQRGYRYVYLDAGHIAQNLALGAVSLGLGSCQIAALYDTEANQLLGLDGEAESVIYMSAVGGPFKAAHSERHGIR